MDFIQSIILGAVQGITEFLPISSSAHLVIIPYLFKWQYQGLIFDVALHFGTLLAIIIFFWRDWINIIANAIKPQISNLKPQTCISNLQNNNCHCEESATKQSGVRVIPHLMRDPDLSVDPRVKPEDDRKGGGDSPSEVPMLESESRHKIVGTNSYPKNLLWILLVATTPGAIAGILLEEQAETIFRSPLIIAISLAVFGIIMWLIDKYSKNHCQLSAINFKLAIYIGLAQMLAIIPGVSRSGSTMSAGRAIGLNRPDSARFSFLLAAPIMLGSALFEARHLADITINASFYIGIITSLVFGLIAIKYLLQYLQKGNYAIFTWYRVILAIIVIAVFLMRQTN